MIYTKICYADGRSMPHPTTSGRVQQQGLAHRRASQSSRGRPSESETDEEQEDEVIDNEGEEDWRSALKQVTGYDPSRYSASLPACAYAGYWMHMHAVLASVPRMALPL